MFWFIHILAIGLALGLAFSGFMVSAGLGDVPGTRSAHNRRIPTAGGLGCIAALGGVLISTALFYPQFLSGREISQIASLAFAVAIMGVWDDIAQSGPRVKFSIFALISAVSVYVVGPVEALPFGTINITLPIWAGYLGSMLWIFVVMNSVNFMDGSNGMMTTVMFIAGFALLLLSFMVGATQSQILLGALLVGLVSLMPYNTRERATIFAGDIGSLSIGYLYAVSFLLLLKETSHVHLLYAGPLLILPFLADALLTLLWRASRRENLLTGHNEHIYQRLIAAGVSHLGVAARYGGLTLVMGICVIAMTIFGFIRYFTLLWVFIAISMWMYRSAHRRLRRLSS